MNKSLLILITIFGASQIVLANIATDFANGIEPTPATEGAKLEGVLPEDAVAQLITEGVEPTEAVNIVRTVYGLTKVCSFSQAIAAYDGVVTVALNTLPDGADSAPLNALYSHCPPTPGAVGGGGPTISPS